MVICVTLRDVDRYHVDIAYAQLADIRSSRGGYIQIYMDKYFTVQIVRLQPAVSGAWHKSKIHQIPPMNRTIIPSPT